MNDEIKTKAGTIKFENGKAIKTIPFNFATKDKIETELVCLFATGLIRPIEKDKYFDVKITSQDPLSSTITFHQQAFLEKDGWEAIEKDFKELKYITDDEIKNELIQEIKNLHNKGIVHNDINAGNIMYNKRTKEVKLIDFGEANYLGKTYQELSAIFENTERLSKFIKTHGMKETNDAIYITNHSDPKNDMKQITDIDYDQTIKPIIDPAITLTKKTNTQKILTLVITSGITAASFYFIDPLLNIQPILLAQGTFLAITIISISIFSIINTIFPPSNLETTIKELNSYDQYLDNTKQSLSNYTPKKAIDIQKTEPAKADTNECTQNIISPEHGIN
jgi:serine/threonine protein kinase